VLTRTPMVFMFDVDNTVLDNDRFGADLTTRLDADVGSTRRQRYWSIYEERREQFDYADYLGALHTFRADSVDTAERVTPHKECMLDEIQRLYPARHYVMIEDKP